MKKRHADGEPERTRRHRHKSRLTRSQKWLVAVAVTLALILVATLAYRSLFVKPELSGKTGDAQADQLDYGDGIRPKSDGERKSKDYYTILVLGRDTGGGGNTDTMLLASYDVTNQKLTVMSIPRDTMVNVSWDIKKINSVYNYYGGGDKGIAGLNKEISQLVGFVPDYQVVVEWAAVGKLVDALGGVYFDVPRNMNYDDPTQDLSIHIQKGYQKLDGEQAMGVIRYRHDNNMKYGYVDGDIGRIATQQAFLKAVVQQLLQIQNVTKIHDLSKIFEENVTTDLTLQNLFWFGKSAILGGLTMDNVNFVTMPFTNTSCWSRTYHNYQSYVTPKADELLELVNTSISPFVEPSTLSELDIMSVNKDGSVSSTTGHVEDSKAAEPPYVPTSTDTTPVDNEPDSGEGTGDSTGTGTDGADTQTPDTGDINTQTSDTGDTGDTGGTDTQTPDTGDTGTQDSGTENDTNTDGAEEPIIDPLPAQSGTTAGTATTGAAAGSAVQPEA